MNWRENWVDWLLKALSGGTAVAVLDQVVRGGKFLGWLIFVGLSTRLPVVFVDDHLLRPAYPHWAGDLLPHAIRTALDDEGRLAERIPTALLLSALVFVLLVAHVLVKGRLAAHEAGPQGPGLVACLRSLFQRGVAVGERCREVARVYRRLYFPLTALLLGVPIALLLAADRRAVWMPVFFALLAIPGFLYLILYPKDLFGGKFREQLTYVLVILLLVFSLVSVPFLYGRRFFDLELPVVESPFRDGEETMVFDQEAGILGTLRQKGDRFAVVFWTADEKPEYDGLNVRSLRDLGTGYELRPGSGESQGAAAYASLVEEP